MLISKPKSEPGKGSTANTDISDFLDEKGRWKCIKCGACCTLVGDVEGAKHLDRGDGLCKHFKRDNTCAIYHNRPDICRVKAIQIKESSEALAIACSMIRNRRGDR